MVFGSYTWIILTDVDKKSTNILYVYNVGTYITYWNVNKLSNNKERNTLFAN